MERQTTIKKLFHEDGIQFAIPAYQRAYSWEVESDRKQIQQFIEDIQEHNPKKDYFFGHFLFEKDPKKDSKYWVIDGQQRLTTIVIFFSCLINELESREKESGKIIDLDDDELDIWRLRENYIKRKNKFKFETVPYDNVFFEHSILESNKDPITSDTSSSRRIKNAREYICDKITPLDLSIILQWKKIIENSKITTFEVSDKVQATQIFAFQNDRGKGLTTLEKIKAFLMHKLYALSDSNDDEGLIRNVESIFSDIYKQSERVKLTEDQVLGHYSTAFLLGWENPFKNVQDELKKQKDKEKWIRSFIKNLKEAFINVELIERQSEKNSAIADLLILDAQKAMPLLLKFYHFHKDDDLKIEDLSRLAEQIIFRLTYKVADYRTDKLPTIAKHYHGDSTKLSEDLNYYIKNGFQPWWSFSRNALDYFNQPYHYTKNIKYILWKYENYLRHKNRVRLISPIEFNNKFGSKRLENTTDHITPITPNFTTYTQDFINVCLNNIGNLTLMVWGSNSEKKNNDPVEKINLFDSDFYSHKEIRDTLIARKIWGEQEIKERQARICKFIAQHWDLV